jgi:putative flippase GtrA
VINALARADVLFARVYPDYRKLVKALIVGVFATVVDTAVLLALTNYVGLFYLMSKAISFLVGMVVSFYFNKTFTFKNTSDKVHYQLASFSIVAFTQYLLTLGLMYVFVDMIFDNSTNVYLIISQIIVAFIGFIYAFLLNKSLTFKIFR